MAKTLLYVLALAVGVLAWRVMPDGPWYRELGGGFLLLLCAELCEVAREVPHA